MQEIIVAENGGNAVRSYDQGAIEGSGQDEGRDGLADHGAMGIQSTLEVMSAESVMVS